MQDLKKHKPKKGVRYLGMVHDRKAKYTSYVPFIYEGEYSIVNGKRIKSAFIVGYEEIE